MFRALICPSSLGSVITNTNEIETEIKSKLAVGNKYYHAFGPILREKEI